MTLVVGVLAAVAWSAGLVALGLGRPSLASALLGASAAGAVLGVAAGVFGLTRANGEARRATAAGLLTCVLIAGFWLSAAIAAAACIFRSCHH